MPKLNKRKLSVLLGTALIVAAIICWYHNSNANSDDVEKTTDSLLAMDTYMTFTVYGDHAQTAINEAKQLIKDREIRWSVTDGNSEINKLNASGQLSISPETVEILSLALQYSDYSNHCFDPTVYPLVKAWGFTTGNYRRPEANELSGLLRCVGTQKFTLNGNNAVLSDGSMLDLGGIAKGFVGDLVISSFKSYGVKSSLINLGGNVQTLGRKPGGENWIVGIQSPYNSGLLGKVSIGECCVITSGAYERYFTGEDGVRYGHIISPFTGYPASNGLMSVTVICDKGSFGDAMSTALFVMGTEEAISFWKSHEGFEVIMLSTEGILYISEGIFPSFTLAESEDVKSICEIKRS